MCHSSNMTSVIVGCNPRSSSSAETNSAFTSTSICHTLAYLLANTYKKGMLRGLILRKLRI